MIKITRKCFHTTRRGALDIGSGSIKCTVGDVENNKILKKAYDDKKEVLFLNDFYKNGMLSYEIIEKGKRALAGFQNKMASIGVESTKAVATEVFRKSPNGNDAIQQFEQVLGTKIDIITQEEEAQLAFQGAVAMSGFDPEKIIVWDCGAGSFQVKSKNNLYFDSWGSGTVHKEAKSIQDPINPFGAQNLNQLAQTIESKLKETPSWIFDRQMQFVAVGTSQSIFNQQRILTGKTLLHLSQTKALLDKLVTLTDDEVLQFETKKYALIKNAVEYQISIDNVNYTLPKLVLLYQLMAKFKLDKLQFCQTNGNCEALLIGDQQKTPIGKQQVSPYKSQAVENDETTLQDKLISVNYHLTRTCNYQCGFCFHTAKNGFNLPIKKAKEGLKLLKESGLKKINFGGGEPFIVEQGKFLGQLVQYCKEQLDLESISIITNGSKVTEEWMKQYGPYLDIMGVSCDSFNDQTNIKIGRFNSSERQAVSHVAKMKQIRNWCTENKVAFKINTVVNSYNYLEDMAAQIVEINPVRWKVFQCLKLEGENSGQKAKRDVTEFLISSEQFKSFLNRHSQVQCLVPEDNETMRDSYVLLDEKMRFLDCSEGKKIPSDSILDVGVEKAFEKSGFDKQLFDKRGGEYEWKKQNIL